jgi:DNA-binding Lrp family transcriptional regulator
MPDAFTPEEARLLDRLQRGFPLVPEPWRELGAELALDPQWMRERVQGWLANGVLTRFGPLFQIEKRGGEFTLCAAEVPAERFDEVAALVNAEPAVAHNYQRCHRLNMWFVLATERAADTSAVLQALEARTRCRLYAFPKQREYFVGLHLPVEACREH